MDEPPPKKVVAIEPSETNEQEDDHENNHHHHPPHPVPSVSNSPPSAANSVFSEISPIENGNEPKEKQSNTNVASVEPVREMTLIIPNLFIGSINDVKQSCQLEKNKIVSVVSVYEGSVSLDKSHSYLCINVADNSCQNIRQHISAVNDFIHDGRQKGAVLVHCLSGVSASASLTVAYLMSITELSFHQLLLAVKKQRPTVQPNVGFTRQLMKFEQENLAEERKRMKTKYPTLSKNSSDQAECEKILSNLNKRTS